MANVFISYNRESAAVAKSLADDIENIGHTVWYDNNLSGGQAWWDQILEKVRNSDIFVFVLDPQALNSTACIREYIYADALGKPILPILASGELSANLLPQALSKIQFVDYRVPDRSAAFKLARAFASLPPTQPLPTPLPAPPEVPVSYLGSLSSKVDTSSTLTYEEQSTLVLDLKRTLSDNEAEYDAHILLKKLRKRRDLFAAIADDIDELLDGLKTKKVSGIDPIQHVKPAHEQSLTEEELSNHDKIEEVIKSPEHSSPRTDSERHSKPSQRQYLKGVIILGVSAMISGLTANYLRYGLFFFPSLSIFGGIIAGFISGGNTYRIMGAIVGIGITLFLYGVYGGDLMMIASILLPSLGAGIVILFERGGRKNKMP